MPHQRQPPGRHPRPREPNSRPAIGFSVDRQAHQFQRHLRRSAFNRRGPLRLERRGSSAPLKSTLLGQRENTAMRFAPFAVFHGQSSAGGSVTFDRTAKPAIGPTGFDRCKFSRREKRRRSHFAPAIIVHPFAQFGSAARTPCLAREKLRHEALFHGKRVAARNRQPNRDLSSNESRIRRRSQARFTLWGRLGSPKWHNPQAFQGLGSLLESPGYTLGDSLCPQD